MKDKMLVIALSLFILSNNYAQAPNIQWQKSLGGSSYDAPQSILATTDGGYIVAGSTSSNDGDVTANHGGDDCWVVKLDEAGAIQWQKALGGTLFEGALEVQNTPDGGYIMVGLSDSNDGDVSGNHGDYDCWVVKLDALGNIQWQKSLGGSSDDQGLSIQTTTDGGYILAGQTKSNDGDVSGNHGNNDAWVVKLDATGAIQWQKALGGTGDDFANAIRTTIDGGYIVAGSSESINGDVSGNHGEFDYWVVKLNTSGDIQWQKSLGGSHWDFSHAIQTTGDGGYILAGESVSSDGDVSGHHGVPFNLDIWVVKLDATGTIQWEKSLGGSGSEQAYSIQATADGGYLVAGNSGTIDGDVTGNYGQSDYWVLKLDASGAIQWQKSFGGTDFEQTARCISSIDGGYMLAGSSMSNDGDVSGNHGGFDFWVVKLEASVATQNVLAASPVLSAYPNPSTSQLTIRLENKETMDGYSLIDLTGKTIIDVQLEQAMAQTEVEFGQIPKGVYLLKVRSGGLVFSEMIILQ